MDKRKKTRTRIMGIDVTRGIAMIIMFMTNFAVVMDTLGDGPKWLVFLYQVIQGKGAATFVILAGIGISLMTRRQRDGGSELERVNVRNTLLRRAFFLFVIGLLFCTEWSADILHYYGVYISIASLLLYVSTPTLTRVSGFFAVGFNLLLIFLDYEAGWVNDWEYVGFWTPSGFIRNLFFNGIHPVFPWITFLLVGMVIGRMNIREKYTRNTIMVRASIIAVMSYLLSFDLERFFTGSELVHLVRTGMMPPSLFYLAAAGGIGVALTMGFQTLCDEYPDSSVIHSIASMGRLALTHYIGHIVIGVSLILIMEPFVKYNLVTSLMFSIGYSIFALASSYLWEKKYGRGPVEQFMRTFTG